VRRRRRPAPVGASRALLPDNGLEVILQPDPTLTTAVVHVWYHVGSKDEVIGKSGLPTCRAPMLRSKHVAEGPIRC
jgi:predicted Zn-dependent peptidase